MMNPLDDNSFLEKLILLPNWELRPTKNGAYITRDPSHTLYIGYDSEIELSIGPFPNQKWTAWPMSFMDQAQENWQIKLQVKNPNYTWVQNSL